MKNQLILIGLALMLAGCVQVSFPKKGPRYQTQAPEACPKIAELEAWTDHMPGMNDNPKTHVHLTLEEYLPFGLSRVFGGPPGDIVLALDTAPGKPRRSFQYAERVTSGKTDRVLITCAGRVIARVEPVGAVY